MIYARCTIDITIIVTTWGQGSLYNYIDVCRVLLRLMLPKILFLFVTKLEPCKKGREFFLNQIHGLVMGILPTLRQTLWQVLPPPKNVD
jgi:hypothetical protein